MRKKIYCAGKVQPMNDWREDIIPAPLLYPLDSRRKWERLIISELDFVYVGPYLVYGHPHDYAGVEHGSPFIDRERVHQNCLSAIDSSDVVFAWLDDTSAYGTLVELGYAKAKNKEIWIAGPEFDRNDDPLWFAYELADELWIDDEHQGISPKIALSGLLLNPYQFDSPIEKMFWNAWKREFRRRDIRYVLTPQHEIGRYRVDFAHVPTKTAIELDGFAFHSNADDIAHDRRRQREIESMGWNVIRFGGKEVHDDVHGCVMEANSRIFYRSAMRKAEK